MLLRALRCLGERGFASAVETWRVLNDDELPFGENAARRNVELS